MKHVGCHLLKQRQFFGTSLCLWWVPSESMTQYFYTCACVYIICLYYIVRSVAIKVPMWRVLLTDGTHRTSEIILQKRIQSGWGKLWWKLSNLQWRNFPKATRCLICWGLKCSLALVVSEGSMVVVVFNDLNNAWLMDMLYTCCYSYMIVPHMKRSMDPKILLSHGQLLVFHIPHIRGHFLGWNLPQWNLVSNWSRFISLIQRVFIEEELLRNSVNELVTNVGEHLRKVVHHVVSNHANINVALCLKGNHSQ